jgi:hypothetical protein
MAMLLRWRSLATSHQGAYALIIVNYSETQQPSSISLANDKSQDSIRIHRKLGFARIAKDGIQGAEECYVTDEPRVGDMSSTPCRLGE